MYDYYLSTNNIVVSSSVMGSGRTQSIYGTAVWTDGYQEMMCQTMTMGDTSVATVTASGCPRTVTGQSPGNTTLTAQVTVPGPGSGTHQLTAQAQEKTKGYVRITSTSANPNTIHINASAGATSTDITVQVLASPNVPQGASVTVGIGKASSTPPTLVFNSGLPNAIAHGVTPGNATEYVLRVGNPNEAGSAIIQADITSRPRDIDVAEPDPFTQSQAKVTVVDP